MVWNHFILPFGISLIRFPLKFCSKSLCRVLEFTFLFEFLCPLSHCSVHCLFPSRPLLLSFFLSLSILHFLSCARSSSYSPFAFLFRLLLFHPLIDSYSKTLGWDNTSAACGAFLKIRDNFNESYAKNHDAMVLNKTICLPIKICINLDTYKIDDCFSTL